MADLSKEQCEKLKEWGMEQTHLDVVHCYDVNLDGPRWAIHTNGGKLDEWEIKIPTITELKEFALTVAQEMLSDCWLTIWFDEIDNYTIAIQITVPTRGVITKHRSKAKTESLALFNLIEKIVEARDED